MKKKTKRVEPRTVHYEVHGWGESSTFRPNLRGGLWSYWGFKSLDEARREVRRQEKDQEEHIRLNRRETRAAFTARFAASQSPVSRITRPRLNRLVNPR